MSTNTNALLEDAYSGDLARIQQLLGAGGNVNTAEESTGLTALHIAVGRNNLFLTRMLIEDWKAAFVPDKIGRMPSLIAAELDVDPELAEYIIDKEREAESNLRPIAALKLEP